jgi:phage gp16-like protein
MTAVLVKTIHVACRDLGLDNDTRRALQLQVTGKASLTAMTDAEQLRVLDALKAKGFSTTRSGKSKGYRKAAGRGDVRFCHVLWGKLAQAGIVTSPGAKGLNSFMRVRFEAAWGAAPIDIDAMTDAKQIATVLEALKAMCARVGITL